MKKLSKTEIYLVDETKLLPNSGVFKVSHFENSSIEGVLIMILLNLIKIFLMEIKKINIMIYLPFLKH